MASKYKLVLVLMAMPVVAFLLGVAFWHFAFEENPLEGCNYVFVLGDDKSHVDQEGDWLVLVEPKKFECRSDWDHDEYSRRGVKYPVGPII